MTPRDGRQLVLGSFEAARVAADPLGPRAFVAARLPPKPSGRVVVIGGGKAAASMALAVERAWPDIALEGLVVTRRAHGLATRQIEVVEAIDPTVDEIAEQASARMMERVVTLTADDLLLVLVSGGAASLMTAPAPGLTIDQMKRLDQALLASGAPTASQDAIRKHCSSIAGGRLAETAARAGATVVALIVADVGDTDPASTGCGPCSPDATTYRDALDLVERHHVDLPYAIRNHLERGADGAIAETAKPGDAVFDRVACHVVATPHETLEAAASFFRAEGLAAFVLGDTVAGEARDVALVHAALAREVHRHAQPWPRPVALLSGGACTVRLPPVDPRAKNVAKTRGGRCSEFVLSLALALDGMPDTWALACRTDGIDGSEGNAGAVLAPDTLARGKAAGIDARQKLDAHDAWGWFDAVDELVVTGPTRTDVGDYRVILLL